jgi:AcrR family transcriptional regulator
MRAEKTDSSTGQAETLDHALELIGEHGVSGLSMAELARRVGLVTSGLYRHYESKAALVTAVIERIGQRLGDALSEIQSQYEDPIGEAPRQATISQTPRARMKAWTNPSKNQHTNLDRPGFMKAPYYTPTDNSSRRIKRPWG